ncbi:MAG: FAD-dependent oxidoreductase [Actinobacteria bacterium]|jgi:2,4-dienoyl-CoA reductase-like NADH-dependent reductase (Old Yellow Enzyme family)|nr:FAD-dependent oxidoreductase [Actinomycetota bacterium]
MYTCRYPRLFSPIRLGDTVFRNRLFVAPVGYEYLSSKNHPLSETVAFYERKAIGGAAAVNVGSAVPDSKRGPIGLSNLYLDDPTALPPVYQLASAINRHGAVAAVELQHCGANAYISAVRGNQIYGAVDGENALGWFVPAMPEEVIEETIEAYGDAAAFAKFCGFGLVTLHAGHGWLLAQFLSPKVNNRKDRWGGSLENRCRLPLAIVERIRQKCGRRFPVEIRISGSEGYEGGYGIDDGVAIAKQLDGKVDLIHVSAGSHEVAQVFTLTHPSMFLPDGVNVEYAVEIKKHVSTPVATVGALNDPEMMEEIIASGKADVVQVARALFADPDLPKKARAGRADEIRPCIRCFECFAGITTKRKNRCAVNPEVGFEEDVRHALPATPPKRVLVVGGGVAGMQAALTASERGHEVVLLEKESRLGGILRCEGKVPFKRLLAEYLDYQVRMLSRVPVEVRLGVMVTPECATAEGADAIICAVGARPCKPDIPGIDDDVLGVEQAYLFPEKTGRRVVVLGGGLAGIELAIYLSGLGRRVTIMEMMETLSDGGNPVHALALMNEIDKHGIEVVTATRAVEITEGGAVGEYVGDAFTPLPSPTVQEAVLQSSSFSKVIRADAEVGSTKLYGADTVVYATGLQPLHAEADALRFCAPEFHQIGDCWIPRNVLEATRMAFAVARDI